MRTYRLILTFTASTDNQAIEDAVHVLGARDLAGEDGELFGTTVQDQLLCDDGRDLTQAVKDA